MEADNIGNKDYIAIVVSKEEMDYNAINNAITRSTRSDFASRVNEALQGDLIPSARYSNTNDGGIYFRVDANSNKAVACIVAIDKR